MYEWALISSAILIGAAGMMAVVRLCKLEAQRIVDEALASVRPPEIDEGEDLFGGVIFDCPECSMPAEVITYVTMKDPDAEVMFAYVVISCLSDHDLITVTKEWFVDHVLSQSRD